MANNGNKAKSSQEGAAVRPVKTGRLFMKQPMMLRMLYALVPVAVAGIYFFGYRVLALLGVCTLAGLASEWLMARRRGAAISIACFVTCFLYALSLPPTMPFWMAVVGIVVGILFGKEFFGGFGRNFANPAIVGRMFVYVAFPIEMTGSFVPAFSGWPGGFVHWSLTGMAEIPQWLSSAGKGIADAVTSATPMLAQRDFGFETPLSELFFGNIGGLFRVEHGWRVLAAGSIGEVSAGLIILTGIYLLITRTANWRLMASPLLGAVLAAILLRQAAGISAVPWLPTTLFSGALLYGSVYMVTEPISAPKTHSAMWVYGFLIGVLIVLLRWKAQFAGAVGFAILMGNICAPSLDMLAKSWANRGKTNDGSQVSQKEQQA